jgi:hypothetical protein
MVVNTLHRPGKKKEEHDSSLVLQYIYSTYIIYTSPLKLKPLKNEFKGHNSWRCMVSTYSTTTKPSQNSKTIKHCSAFKKEEEVGAATLASLKNGPENLLITFSRTERRERKSRFPTDSQLSTEKKMFKRRKFKPTASLSSWRPHVPSVTNNLQLAWVVGVHRCHQSLIIIRELHQMSSLSPWNWNLFS